MTDAAISAPCECGVPTGQRCGVELFSMASTVLVDWVPPRYRHWHDAGRIFGRWPYNGTQRLRVSPRCLPNLLREGWAIQGRATR